MMIKLILILKIILDFLLFTFIQNLPVLLLTKIELVFQKDTADILSRRLAKINPLLQLKFLPGEMKFRIISDSRKEKKIGAMSV